ncbi:MAG TPA: hypothetical protein VFJ91_03365 [Gaiellaceae bacterium]|nr:hypothetical protein [Gaiellaceae bacterium]
MAQMASRAFPQSEEDPPVDPSLIQLRYRYHRAQRHSRIVRRQESRLAQYRFYIAMTVLVGLSAIFVVASWHEIQHLFGI